MTAPFKYAILIDGAFAIRCIEKRKKDAARSADASSQNGPSNPSPARTNATWSDIDGEIVKIKSHNKLKDLELLRVYFYDAAPASGVLTNPLSSVQTNLGSSQIFSERTSLHQSLEMLPDVALRMGEAAVHGWTIGDRALKSLQKTPRPITANDLVPNVEQKGVDLRIGLDIARLSLRAMVHVIVVLTGDSDLVPAFKFARREGVRIYLDHMGHGVKRELKVHTDLIL